MLRRVARETGSSIGVLVKKRRCAYVGKPSVRASASVIGWTEWSVTVLRSADDGTAR